MPFILGNSSVTGEGRDCSEMTTGGRRNDTCLRERHVNTVETVNEGWFLFLDTPVAIGGRDTRDVGEDRVIWAETTFSQPLSIGRAVNFRNDFELVEKSRSWKSRRIRFLEEFVSDWGCCNQDI